MIGPSLRWRAANIRTPGTVAKVNLVLAGLPAFSAAGTGAEAEHLLRGRIVIAPGIDYIEHAFDASKYGQISPAPFLEVTIPSLIDPGLLDPPSAAGRGVRAGASTRRAAQHVMSVHFQYAPYALREGTWPARREEIGEIALATLEAYAPGIAKLVVGRQVLSPLDLEQDVRPDRRPSVPRRAEPRELLRLAAAPGQRPLSPAGRGPLPGRVGRPSGRRDHRHSGPERGPRDRQRLEEAPALRPPSSSSSSTSGSIPGLGSLGTRIRRPSRRSTRRAARWAIVSPVCSSR